MEQRIVPEQHVHVLLQHILTFVQVVMFKLQVLVLIVLWYKIELVKRIRVLRDIQILITLNATHTQISM